MYAPPAPTLLSMAEIEARKALTSANQTVETQGVRRTSEKSGGSAKSRQRSSSGQANAASGIFRKIANLSIAREKAAKKTLGISPPLPSSPPMKNLPALPDSSPGLERRHLTQAVAEPKRVDSAQGLSSISIFMGDGMSPPSRPPPRPPRPSSELLPFAYPPYHAGLATDLTSAPAKTQAVPAGIRAEQRGKAKKRPTVIDDDDVKLTRTPRKNVGQFGLRIPSEPSSPESTHRNKSQTPRKLSKSSPQAKRLALETSISILPTPLGAPAPDTLQSVKEQPAKQNGATSLISVIKTVGWTTNLQSHLMSPTQLSPTETQIQLRTGSILTVTPPELDCWHRSTYLHGPIRLRQPYAPPRKNSVATLELFQDAVDKVFEDGESITKRKSELAIAEDICTFFTSFTLGECKYSGDVLAVEGAEDSDESCEGDLTFQCQGQRFMIPPDSPTAWRHRGSRLEELPALPPVENEETLRAKGIDWLSRHRLQSKLANPENELPFMPEPEDSMLEVVLAASANTTSVDQNDSTWLSREDVEETDAVAPWIKSARGHTEHRVAAAFRRRSH